MTARHRIGRGVKFLMLQPASDLSLIFERYEHSPSIRRTVVFNTSDSYPHILLILELNECRSVEIDILNMNHPAKTFHGPFELEIIATEKLVYKYGELTRIQTLEDEFFEREENYAQHIL